MGLCFPKQCSIDEVRYFTSDLITGYAEGVGWTNVKIDYHPASVYDLAQTDTTSGGAIVFGIVIATAFLLAGAGTLVEMSSFGDRKDIDAMEDKAALHEASKFRRLIQYESVLLQRKEPWARTLLMFSPIRNIVLESLQPRTLRTAINQEEQDPNIPKDRYIAKYLKVFNGIKAVSMIYAAWGVTFYFAWFSVISNMTDVDNMRQTIGFNIVSAAVYTVPIFFFCSGFLQTYSFVQKVED